MIEKIKSLWNKYPDYNGVVLFVIVLTLSHFFWKFTVLGDEGDVVVTLFGLDISAPFTWMTYHIAGITHEVCNFFGMETILHDTTVRHTSTGNSCRIVWGCSGIKQSFIFAMILLFSRGRWLHKLWYVLVGLLVVYIVNISRIILLTMIIANHPEYFGFMHDYVFKYLFYFIIFLVWVFWNDYLVPRLNRN